VIEGNFVADDLTNTTERVDDSSDEDVGTTFDRIRKSLAQNSVNDEQKTVNSSLKTSTSNIIEKSDNFDNNKEKIKFLKKNGCKRNTFLLDDSDVEDDVTPIKVPSDDCDNGVSEQNLSLKKLLEDSDEDDLEKSIVTNKKKNDIRQRSTTIKHVIESNFVDDDLTNTTERVDDSSDEDMGTTFDRIRKSLAQNSVNDEQKTVNSSLKTSTSNIIEKSDNFDNSKEKIKFNKKNGRKRNTFLLEDSDVEDDFTPKKVPSDDCDNGVSEQNLSLKKMLEDSDEDDLEKSIVTNKTKKTVFEDSDEEEEREGIHNQNISEQLNNDNREKNVVSMKTTIEVDIDANDRDTEKNVVSTKKKVETSAENVADFAKRFQLDSSDEEDFDKNLKRKPLSTNSDSEEEIGFVKKTKYFINDDSD